MSGVALHNDRSPDALESCSGLVTESTSFSTPNNHMSDENNPCFQYLQSHPRGKEVL